MLLRFRVANVRSLRDEQELSLAVPENEEGHAARETLLSDGRALSFYPTAGIFGPNASGKSNVITALKRMRETVLSSYTEWTSFKSLPRDPFALDRSARAESSFFEVDFVLGDGVRWTYGFELSDTRVEGEWLHSYPRGRRQEWLDRDATRAEAFRFPGDHIKDRARLARTTRANALLLSRAAMDNHPDLTRIYQWFQDNLWDITPEAERPQREAFTARRLAGDDATRRRIEELLQVADLGISGAEIEQRAGKPPVIRLRHAAADAESDPAVFDWEKESFGTRSWFALLGPALLALEQGAVLLIDELDSSLHPRMAAEVVRLFHSRQVNPHNAQLVFTAHDPSLLQEPGGGRLLAPGQVWLTEKDKRGATSLFPLSGFEPPEEEDLMASYLAGVFGGVPRVSEGQVGRALLMAETMEAEHS
ncbi:AAA family ATPase [Streptomyces mayteni]